MDEVLDQGRDVFAPFAQGRHMAGRHVHPIIEILAKATFLHFLLDVAVGGRNQTHVDGHRFLAAHTFDLLLLQNPQQLDL